MADITPRPADAILFERGVLTRLRPQDAEDFIQAVADNALHLSDWVPWADDPQARQAKAEGADADWLADRAYVYALRLEPTGQIIGGLGLYRRVGEGAIELGYWVAADHTGTGLASAAVSALASVAIALADIERLELHIDQANVPSSALARRLGFRLARVYAYDPVTPAQSGRMQVWLRP